MNAFRKQHDAEYLKKWPRCICSHSKQMHMVGCRRCSCRLFVDVLTVEQPFAQPEPPEGTTP